MGNEVVKTVEKNANKFWKEAKSVRNLESGRGSGERCKRTDVTGGWRCTKEVV